jgi:DNA-binding MarR family transcriptional regulator
MTKAPSGARPADSIDQFLRQWRQARPDLRADAFGVFGRIHRIFGHFMHTTEPLLADMELGWESFSLIVTLRRSGPPFAMRPTDLLHESLLSSGAITNRIDRVERQGLVTRSADPHDRRVVIVKLTPAGRALADRAIKRHFESMADMLSPLSSEERRSLMGLLGKLLVSMEKMPRKSAKRKTGTRAITVPHGKPRAGAPPRKLARNRMPAASASDMP